MSQEPETTGDKALVKLRRSQAERVMPLIGPLIDAWCGMPTDLRGDIEEQAEQFTLALHEVIEALEGADYE